MKRLYPRSYIHTIFFLAGGMLLLFTTLFSDYSFYTQTFNYSDIQLFLIALGISLLVLGFIIKDRQNNNRIEDHS